MGKFRINNVTEACKSNGFRKGQIVEGVIKMVKFPQPNERTCLVLEVSGSESFIYADQVEEVQ
jgi:aminoglycoside phosphotransferase family enzyme